MTDSKMPEPVAWRWRPKGKVVWTYDPTPEWLELHKDEVDAEPLYAHPAPVADAELEALKIASALEACDWAGSPIGNKMILRAAVVALRARTAQPVGVGVRKLEWSISKGGAWCSGPYMVAERVDDKGWNATALFEMESVKKEPQNFSTHILLAASREDCIAACEKAHACILSALLPEGGA